MKALPQTSSQSIRRRAFLVIALGLVLFMVGCGQKAVVKEAAEFRKSGQPEAARLAVTVALEKHESNLDLWRELAAADLDIARKNATAPEALPMLCEAALLCATLKLYKHGKLDAEWANVGRLTGTELEHAADNALQHLRSSIIEEPRDHRFRNLPGEDTDDFMHRVMKEIAKPPEETVDPAIAAEATKRYAVAAELIPQLPATSIKIMEAGLKRLDEKLNNTVQYTNITGDQMTGWKAAARNAVGEAVRTVSDDLENNGAFRLETLKNIKLVN